LAGELQDKVAVVTAAASGMGREACLRFAAEGAHVVAIDIDEQGGLALLEEIRAATVDLTDLDQIAEAIATVGKAHGRIDVLFNHAGAPGPRGYEFDADVWDFQVALNLRAPIFLTKAALPLMKGGGSVIFTSSVSGLIASRNSPVYAALKAGVIGYMRCVAAMGGEDNLRANAIAPGTVETPMLAKFFSTPDETDEVLQERLTSFYKAVPLGRAARTSEIGDLVLFLASDRSSYITGTVIPIDGGYVAL
jgi:NAD(P)-dependent dehydrogenase (short-subunit alcohol dehydrogenase family)